MQIIDFGDFTQNGRIRNLSGKPRGVDARIAANLDELDASIEPIGVHVPEHIYAVSPSFFLGMFSQSLSKFGAREAFLKHYLFDADEVVWEQINIGIDRFFVRPILSDSPNVVAA